MKRYGSIALASALVAILLAWRFPQSVEIAINVITAIAAIIVVAVFVFALVAGEGIMMRLFGGGMLVFLAGIGLLIAFPAIVQPTSPPITTATPPLKEVVVSKGWIEIVFESAIKHPFGALLLIALIFIIALAIGYLIGKSRG